MAVLVEAQGEMLDSIEAQVAKARRWRKWVGGQGCAGLAGGACGPRTATRNLILAGDWTQTGLPATLEGAVRSGDIAARLAARHLRL